MKSDKAHIIFRELTIGSKLNVKLCYFGQAELGARADSYQIEIQTPLPPGTKKFVDGIKKRYGLSEIRKPISRFSGQGTLYLL